MIRGAAVRAGIGMDEEFRWRGGEITRLEGFTDAVFAFAVTLLVVSLEVPATFDDLLHAMRGFFAFGVCFTLLMTLWHDHYLYFRRYGLQTMRAQVLNMALIFVTLFYVYPLKFLFTLVFEDLFGIGGHAGQTNRLSRIDQVVTLFVIYDLGIIAIWSTFLLLYRHALERRQALGLDAIEVLYTREKLWGFAGNIGVGCLSLAIILIGGPRLAWAAGVVFTLIGAVQAGCGVTFRRRRDKVRAAGTSS
jgi:uncharacterized membrane protein